MARQHRTCQARTSPAIDEKSKEAGKREQETIPDYIQVGRRVGIHAGPSAGGWATEADTDEPSHHEGLGEFGQGTYQSAPHFCVLISHILTTLFALLYKRGTRARSSRQD